MKIRKAKPEQRIIFRIIIISFLAFACPASAEDIQVRVILNGEEIESLVFAQPILSDGDIPTDPGLPVDPNGFEVDGKTRLHIYLASPDQFRHPIVNAMMWLRKAADIKERSNNE